MSSTIAAIATSTGSSGVGIIRVSGNKSIDVVNKIWGSDITKYNTHTIHYGKVVSNRQVIDEAILLLMKAPKSYTGEDVVEIQCHGGSFVLRKILELLLDNGAAMATPGEFTKRAFLNGKLDLSQAEAVMDLIESKNEDSRKSAISQLEGELGKKIREYRSIILHHTAFIETALDDPEHIDVSGYGTRLKKEILPIISKIDLLIKTWDDGRIIKSGIRTAILGKPNAGKSSLLNALIGIDRAIVTDMPGTTRDTIEEEINLSNISLKLVDTAGIRDTDDAIEKIGVEKALDESKKADLILYVIDIKGDYKDEIEKVIEYSKNSKVIILFNKIDSVKSFNEDCVKNQGVDALCISAKENLNIDKLKNRIKKLFETGALERNDEIIITNIRHKEALVLAKKSLDKVITSIESNFPEDFYSIDLMDAYESLGKITGESTGEDLINEIFSRFCVGK